MKSIKRSLSLLLAVVMVFSALAFIQSSVYAVAEDALEVSLGDSNGNALPKSEVKPGEEFTFVVSVNPGAANPLASFDVSVKYDSTKVELLNAKSSDIKDYTTDQKAQKFIGDAAVIGSSGGGFKTPDGATLGNSEVVAAGGVQYIDNKTDGKIQFYALVFDEVRLLKGECKLIVLRFKAKSDISTETSAVFTTDINGENFSTIKELENGDTGVVSVTKPDGTLAYTSPSSALQLTIKPATTPDPGEDPKPPSDIMLGDIDRNGTITVGDAQQLFNYTRNNGGKTGALKEVSEKERLAMADIDGNGSIAVGDAQQLFNFARNNGGKTGNLKK